MSSTSPGGVRGATGAGGATGGAAAAAWAAEGTPGCCTAPGRPLALERSPVGFGCAGRMPAGACAWTADAAGVAGGVAGGSGLSLDGCTGPRSRAGAVAATAAAAPVTPESSPGAAPGDSGRLPFFACTSCSGEVTAFWTRCVASFVACAARDACARSAAATSYAVDALVVDPAPLPDGGETRVASSGRLTSAGVP